MLLLVGLALAHVPHDTVAALAAPAALDGSAPWWLVANPQGQTLLLRSDDAGRTWTYIGGEPLMDDPVDAARLTDGTLVLLADTRYWWSTDEGATWDRADLPGAVTLVEADDAGGMWLAGAGGLWHTTPGGLAEAQIPDVPIVALSPGGTSPGGIAADSLGALWVEADGAWTTLRAPARNVDAVAIDAGVVYAGTSDGALWRWSDGWTACTPPPASTPPNVVSIAATGGAEGAPVVFVATALHAGWTSTDDCATWTDRGVADEVEYDVDGAANSPTEAWPVLLASGETRVAAGWAGLYHSEDGGRTWLDAPIIAEDHTRGMAFAPDFPTSHRILVGGYAAGVLITEDDGATWTAPNHGMIGENVQRVVYPRDPDHPDTVLSISGHSPWLSMDQGESWRALLPGDVSAAELMPWCSVDDVWMLVNPTAVLSGADDWAEVTLPETEGDIVGAVAFGDEKCMTARNPSTVACGTDGDWDILYVGASPHPTWPVAWPPVAPTRLVFGDEEGVHVTDDRGLHWTTTHVDEDRPELLVEADDGTLLLSTRSGRLLRSADGGDTWVDPGDRLPAMASVLTPRPAFAAHPDVLVGTRDGVWLWSEGAAPARWAPFQRLDNTSGFWDRTDPPAPIVDTEAAMDSVQGIPEGTTFAAWVRGDRFDVIGRGDPDGGVIVSVDGATVAQSLGDAPPGIAVLVSVDGLTDAWHRLELRGVGTGILLDAVEVWGEGASLPSFDDPTPAPPGDCPTPDTGTASTEKPGCGCATDLRGSGSAALVAGVILLAARRRRAPTASAS